MRGSGARRSFLALTFVGAALSVCGCGGPNEPCPGVVKGATYQVELHEPTAKDDPADCRLDWGLKAGFTLLATPHEVADGGSCLVGRPELDGAMEWTFERQPGEQLFDGFMESSYQAQFRECENFVSLRLGSATGFPCFVDDKASSAECLLKLNIDPRGGKGCPARCLTRLAVTVTRQ